MKDLEKIKSEDLGCQVADANPANFAIEQEVGAMVGATVPAPTEPSADDARELGAQLLVFLRRALLPIRSALRTALADIYAHLDSRCTDYTPAAYASYIPRPYDPMGSSPRTLPNLLTALTAFAPRKISNGSAPNDGIKDGSTIAHIVSTPAGITKLIDDNQGWTANRAGWLSTLLNLFTDATYVEIACEKCTAEMVSANISGAREVHIKAKSLSFSQSSYSNYMSDSDLYFDELETCNFVGLGSNPIIKPKRLFLPKFKSGTINVGYSASGTNSATIYMYIGCYGKPTDTITFRSTASSATTQALQKIEVHQGTRQRISFQYSLNDLGNLTAENIVSGIFDKLADNTDGAPITLNLGTYLLGKLSAEQKAIAQNKNYTLA